MAQGDGSVASAGNVLIGEVWVASGQSNMEWPLAASFEAQAEIAASADPQLRMFTVQKTIAANLKDDVTGSWQSAGPTTSAGFSAVGYYFARKLRKELGVPGGRDPYELGRHSHRGVDGAKDESGARNDGGGLRQGKTPEGRSRPPRKRSTNGLSTSGKRQEDRSAHSTIRAARREPWAGRNPASTRPPGESCRAQESGKNPASRN